MISWHLPQEEHFLKCFCPGPFPLLFVGDFLFSEFAIFNNTAVITPIQVIINNVTRGFRNREKLLNNLKLHLLLILAFVALDNFLSDEYNILILLTFSLGSFTVGVHGAI